MAEALLITGVAGYAGLVAGVPVIELVAQKVPAVPFFRSAGGRPQGHADRHADGGRGAGLLSGLSRRCRAARVNPIVALRDG